ncbi:hypothetical protein ACFL15_02680 [Patescibacteria group bacterium]
MKKESLETLIPVTGRPNVEKFSGFESIEVSELFGAFEVLSYAKSKGISQEQFKDLSLDTVRECKKHEISPVRGI